MSTRYCVKLINAALGNSMYFVQVYTYGFLTCVKSHEKHCIKLSSFLTKEKKFINRVLVSKKPKTLRFHGKNDMYDIDLRGFAFL